ncbi:MAG TPA: peptidoglycan DD-metalloendopeptidase family protein [Candidatus Dormibacteraeota bacterium]|nr:peptidoglycan DD-metalloendopeptidase family protein [Candidatus Dormibacteraeota bacterium]
MKRALVALTIAAGLAALQVSTAGATTPSTCTTSSTASASRTTCPASTPIDPNAAAYAQLRGRLGSDLANALAAQQRLTALLDQDAVSAQALSGKITQEEAVIANIEAEITQLDAQISDTQQRIEVEKQQLSVMARAIYRQPDSFWILLARTGSLHDALMSTADLVVAGQRANDLEKKLEADLAALQAQLQQRQDQLDQENNTLDLLVANLSALNDLISQQTDVSSQLADLVTQIQTADSGLTGQPPDVTTTLAQLLEAQEQDLVLRSYQSAWTQAQVGTGLALVTHELPVGKAIDGLHLQWPMVKFQITQPFGPSSVLLEPRFGQYAHFHTGVDIAAPLGTPVMAAADGVVVAVGHTAVGYGNYVVIAHGGGIATLYGHLLDTNVVVGQVVVRGQQVGREGSTGFSTGPHVHFELRINNAFVDPMPYLPVPGTSWSG